MGELSKCDTQKQSKYLLSEIGNNKRRVAPNFQLVKIEKINALFAKPNKAKHNETGVHVQRAGEGQHLHSSPL